ncbi:hypothetical protein PC118_g19138 [Phytophthora cactorum]|uniref:Uncharacterized protein n=1 Tax=Phytophthora cactorum TaxID=29920 RepID=A0A8T1F6I4_9STRA|nr:hypothetical protein PC112_g19485 [Phytophthora cactorum]KAG2840123.1 hypothetical protein PC113_g19334 [Phytophthora cactorum]KAG2966502.1 hypothetical protein PC118_g19138 [Phytophthora cactorum]
MFKLKKEADAKASAWSAMPRRFWALHYFCNPLSNGLCAPVFDKISILTASDDLHALQLRHTPMQTEAYRAVLDKSSRPKSAPVENLRSQKVEEMVVRRETRQGKTAFMKRLQAFHVGDRPRLMMEHHTFLARERSTDADFTTAELAIVATERPAAPLAPEAPTVVAAARCGSKNIGWIRQEAVDAKEEAVDQAWRLGDEKQDDEEEDRDDEEWYKEDDFDAPISANAEVKGKAAGKAKAASKAPTKVSSAVKKPHRKSTKTLAKEARGQRQTPIVMKMRMRCRLMKFYWMSTRMILPRCLLRVNLPTRMLTTKQRKIPTPSLRTNIILGCTTSTMVRLKTLSGL